MSDSLSESDKRDGSDISETGGGKREPLYPPDTHKVFEKGSSALTTHTRMHSLVVL